MITPAITAIIIAVSAALAFSGGFALESWRKGAQIAKLESGNAVLTAANGRCATDIATARKALADVVTAAAARERRAIEAQRQAEPEAQQHTKKAKQFLVAAPVAADKQCEAIKREQILYVQSRAD